MSAEFKIWVFPKSGKVVRWLTNDPHEGMREAGWVEMDVVPAGSHDALVEALEEIAKEDELVTANPGVFAIHAFKRVQEQARTALALARNQEEK